MKIKAVKSFSGVVSAAKGQVLDVPKTVAADLIGAGYAVAVEEEKKPKTAKK